jgi:hypothetical protein
MAVPCSTSPDINTFLSATILYSSLHTPGLDKKTKAEAPMSCASSGKQNARLCRQCSCSDSCLDASKSWWSGTWCWKFAASVHMTEWKKETCLKTWNGLYKRLSRKLDLFLLTLHTRSWDPKSAANQNMICGLSVWTKNPRTSRQCERTACIINEPLCTRHKRYHDP